MTRNVGSRDRTMRAFAAVLLLTCSVAAPLPLEVRIAGFGVLGAYLLLTALAGSCLGYRLLGRSTCPVEPRT